MVLGASLLFFAELGSTGAIAGEVDRGFLLATGLVGSTAGESPQTGVVWDRDNLRLRLLGLVVGLVRKDQWADGVLVKLPFFW